MKRRRLKKWVKVTLMGLVVILIYMVLSMVGNRLNNMYEQCDIAKGYTCSYYEARQYLIRGE